jgi:hypothetical protein
MSARMNGLSLHYYTLPTGNWSHKGFRHQFHRGRVVQHPPRALDMDRPRRPAHSAIMDRYDPQKKVGLIVDEWGTWYDVEPGTNPGFLYQQNTLRDALVAGVTLNIFNRHCDRVKMANIAQIINVLQAMILTDKEKMIVTPTYWAFLKCSPHHDATLLPSELQSADYEFNSQKIPDVSASASRDQAGKIHVTLCNLNPNQPAEVAVRIAGRQGAEAVRPRPDRAGHERAQHLRPAGRGQARRIFRVQNHRQRFQRHAARQIRGGAGSGMITQNGSSEIRRIVRIPAKRQRAGAVQDASRFLIIIVSRTAFWSAAALRRFPRSQIKTVPMLIETAIHRSISCNVWLKTSAAFRKLTA